MSNIEVRLERLGIVVHGVSAGLVETAMAGFEDELRRRLGNAGLVLTRKLDAGELALSPVAARAGLDAAALRALIVDRLIETLADDRRGAVR